MNEPVAEPSLNPRVFSVKIGEFRLGQRYWVMSPRDGLVYLGVLVEKKLHNDFNPVDWGKFVFSRSLSPGEDSVISCEVSNSEYNSLSIIYSEVELPELIVGLKLHNMEPRYLILRDFYTDADELMPVYNTFVM